MKMHDITFTPGLSVIGLYYPREDCNIGSVLRAAFCFRSDMVVVESEKKYRVCGTDTTKAYLHMPLIHTGLKSAIPFRATPIAVELSDNATPLIDFVHPRSAYYIFGPENGSLGKSITSWCADTIYIPTRQCLNLAQTVNVVLYDRMAKSKIKRCLRCEN